ncbi:DUF3500 domain-containing protein [Candidatus Rariloculus sp.]|uniref:DUF3500 domain-containing protein n=1 Tax=Candidatus Rariloculus sp. TaxID=3101265 RepID=UPI003D1045CE
MNMANGRVTATAIGLAAATYVLAAFGQQTSEQAAPPASTSARQMTAAAAAFVELLTPAQRELVTYPVEGEARTDWSNTPPYVHPRPGLRVGELSEAQRVLLHDLLRASLSSQGYQKIAGVMRLDDIHRERSVAGLPADASDYTRAVNGSFGTMNYSVALFGDPRSDSSWAWLLQGHHLGASFTVADGRAAIVPLFLGATPLPVPEDFEIGWSALSHEMTRGQELMRSLTADQRSAALSAEEVPGDVINGVGSKLDLTLPAGLKAADMTAPQQRLLRALVEEFVRNADFDAAEEHLAAIEQAGWDELSFSWRGTLDDPDEAYYYRVQGPRVVIECRCAPGHIHTMMRDPANDYGERWLGLNYLEEMSAADRFAAAQQRAAE